MIHVICLNPAIDKFYEINGFMAGEDYPGQRPRCVNGGKGVNVARVLAQMGEHSTLYAYLGDGAKALEQEMRGLCDCVFFPVPGACRTTINILDRANGRETVITEAGPTIQPAHVNQLLFTLEDMIAPGDIVVCSGSIIAGAVYAMAHGMDMEETLRLAMACGAANAQREDMGMGAKEEVFALAGKMAVKML